MHTTDRQRRSETYRHTYIYMQGHADIHIEMDRQTDRQDLHINQSISVLLMNRQTDRQPAQT